MNKIYPYLKFIMAILGTIDTSLAAFYGSAKWYLVVTAVVTALAVYLVPNYQPMQVMKPADVPTQPMPSVQKDTENNPFGGGM